MKFLIYGTFVSLLILPCDAHMNSKCTHRTLSLTRKIKRKQVGTNSEMFLFSVQGLFFSKRNENRSSTGSATFFIDLSFPFWRHCVQIFGVYSSTTEQYCSVYLYNVQFHATTPNALMLSHPSIDLFVALTCSHIFSPLCSSTHSLVHPSSYTNQLFSIILNIVPSLPLSLFFLSQFIRFAILLVGSFVR